MQTHEASGTALPSLPLRLHRRAVFVVIVLVTLVKAGLAVAFVPHPRTFEDHDVAVGLVEHGALARVHLGQLNHTIQFPVYPAAVSLVYAVAGVRPPLVLAVNVVITALGAWVLLQLTTLWWNAFDADGRARAFGPAVLWLTLLGFLVYPPLQQYVMATVHPMAVDLTVFYLALWAAHVYLDRGERPQDLVWLGVVAGLVLLTRTVMLVAFLPVLVTVVTRRGVGAALRQAALVLLVGFAVGTPWLVRNYVSDRIVGYTSTTGEILWKGVRPGSDGSNFDDTGIAYGAAWTPEQRRALESMTVAEQNHYFLDEYLHIVRTDPMRVMTMYGRKLVHFFWFRAAAGNDYGVALRRLLPIYKFAYGVMLTGALLAVWRFGARTRAVWLPVVALGASQAFFYVETRHRVLIEPLLLFLALATAASLAAAWRARAAQERMP